MNDAERGRALAYFDRYQALIQERLAVRPLPDDLSDAERVELANRYLSLVAE
jgi:hypothetical protein